MSFDNGRPSAWFWAGLALIVCYFFYFAGGGLRAGFFPDVMMNINYAWERPVSRLWLDCFWPDSTAYRPVGALVYRALYENFGLSPLPYRLVCFALLIANLLLSGWLAGLLGRSLWVGLWTMALFAFNAYFSDLYYSSATLYDLLCGCFSFAFLTLYVRARTAERPVPWWHSPVLVVLLVAAIGSKELGILLPLCLVILECCFLGVWPRLNWKSVLPGALCLLTGLLAVAARFTVTTIFTENHSYQIVLTRERILSNFAHYGGMLFYVHRDLMPKEMLFLALGALLLAALARSRAAAASLILFFVLMGPVLVIEPRSLYAIYVPYVFLCAFLALALQRLTSLPWCRERVVGPVLLLVLLAGLAPRHAYSKPFGDVWIGRDAPQVAAILREFRKECPTAPRAATIYLSSDAVAEDDYLVTFTLRLLYHDREINVVRQKQTHHCPTEQEWASYARKFNFDNWTLRPIADRTDSCPGAQRP
ncbi:hypothetical protein [uncultured Paludibaculum sp.]|uniref:ArnT family glycosyltransferase n=1 Tax=uncultured Paludibaculum sp. TaxID=1765020 RepID=UPI002AAB4D01|nr:hypothetical protein [uncultured Paludibaculum sp.]